MNVEHLAAGIGKEGSKNEIIKLNLMNEKQRKKKKKKRKKEGKKENLTL